MSSLHYMRAEDGTITSTDDWKVFVEWLRKEREPDGFEKHRRIGLDFVGSAEVSTVFLPNDHSFGGSTPILFETMVFGGAEVEGLDQFQMRYSTEAEARETHAKIVARLRECLAPERLLGVP